jgi:hypothetical protein
LNASVGAFSEKLFYSIIIILYTKISLKLKIDLIGPNHLTVKFILLAKNHALKAKRMNEGEVPFTFNFDIRFGCDHFYSKGENHWYLSTGRSIGP